MSKIVGNFEFNPDHWLGSGSFATVYKGQHRVTKEPYAIKEIDLKRLACRHDGIDEIKMLKCLNNEIQTMKALHHPNILKLEDVTAMGDIVYMVIEYCSGGDIGTLLRSIAGKGIREKETHRIMKQIMSALRYMHSLGIVHRDLKPQNILLSRPVTSFSDDQWDENIIKLADFGFAKTLTATQLTETICGSPLYMAPEVLSNCKYTDNADLWSFGIILYEVLTGCPPYAPKNILELSNIQKSITSIQLPVYIAATKSCRDLISSLLVVDPVNRMSWEAFLNHPWFISEQNFKKSDPQIHIINEDDIISSAPPRLQNWLKVDETLLHSFEIIDVSTFSRSTTHEKTQTEDDTVYELRRWLDRLKTLIRIGNYQMEILHYVESYEVFDHANNLLKVIIETAIDYVQKFNLTDSEQSVDSSYKDGLLTVEERTKNRLKLLILQFKTYLAQCTEKLDACYTSIKRGERCKPTDKLLFDIAISLAKQGKAYTRIETWDEAIEKYATSIDLLECLIPFSDKESQSILHRYITVFNKKIHNINRTIYL